MFELFLLKFLVHFLRHKIVSAPSDFLDSHRCRRPCIPNQLQTLDLSFNKIGDAGLASFSGTLGKGALPQLKVLELEQNQIGDDGLSSFSEALASGALPKCHTFFLGYKLLSKQ